MPFHSHFLIPAPKNKTTLILPFSVSLSPSLSPIHSFFYLPFLNHLFLYRHTTILICLLISPSFNYLQEPFGICRPMNLWRWWSSTMACRPWPMRSSSPTQGGSTSQMRTRSLAMPNGPPSSRTPPAASGRASQKVVNTWIKWMSINSTQFLNVVMDLFRDGW